MSEIRIEPSTGAHAAGMHAALDSVARERRFLMLLEAPPVEGTAQFIDWLRSGAGVQFVAVAPGGSVVGWCDIVRAQREGFTHNGQLGMGVVESHRRRGIGRGLVVAAIAAAPSLGISRIELEVFASNTGAIALYEQLGFAREGVKRGARVIDGITDDVVLMARTL
jgi:RimJ/RimL family protein N-acetyltransferase